MRMKNTLARGAWLPLLLSAAISWAPGVRTVRADASDNDPTVFGDGVYHKFGLDLGYAGRTHRWAIYTYGAGTPSTPYTALDVSNWSLVFGDVALAGANSRVSVHDYALITGDRYEQTTSTETTNNYGFIGGTRFSNASTNTSLNSGVTSLKNVSIAAAALAATGGSPTNINMNGGSQTFNNNPFGGKYVMKLTNFTLTNSATLTLNGAAGSAFVINVSNNFSLDSHSRILLTGGLTASDVLFNVTGAGGTTQILGSSLFKGTLLAYNSATGGTQRTVTVSDPFSMTRGQIIANKVVVKDGSWCKKPRKVSKDRDDDDDERDRKHERDCD
jgi:hypothetical protein